MPVSVVGPEQHLHRHELHGTCLVARSAWAAERPWFWIGDGDLLDFIDGVMERFAVGDKVLASSALFHCKSIHEPPNSIHEVEFILQASPFPKNHPEK